MLAAVPVVGLFKLLLKKLLFKIDGDHEHAPSCNRCYEVDGDKLRVFSEQPIITDQVFNICVALFAACLTFMFHKPWKLSAPQLPWPGVGLSPRKLQRVEAGEGTAS